MDLALSLANVLANIVTKLGNTELNYISDFKIAGKQFHRKYVLSTASFIPEQTSFLSQLADYGIPVWQYENYALRKRQEKYHSQSCPTFQKGYVTWAYIHYLSFIESIFSLSEEATSEVQLEKKEILPTSRHHRTIFIWITGASISDALRVLDDSVLWCDQVGAK